MADLLTQAAALVADHGVMPISVGADTEGPEGRARCQVHLPVLPFLDLFTGREVVRGKPPSRRYNRYEIHLDGDRFTVFCLVAVSLSQDVERRLSILPPVL